MNNEKQSTLEILFTFERQWRFDFALKSFLKCRETMILMNTEGVGYFG